MNVSCSLFSSICSFQPETRRSNRFQHFAKGGLQSQSIMTCRGELKNGNESVRDFDGFPFSGLPRWRLPLHNCELSENTAVAQCNVSIPCASVKWCPRALGVLLPVSADSNSAWLLSADSCSPTQQLLKRVFYATFRPRLYLIHLCIPKGIPFLSAFQANFLSRKLTYSICSMPFFLSNCTAHTCTDSPYRSTFKRTYFNLGNYI